MSIDEEKEDEEISIDFSKIKNIFKRKKKEAIEAPKSEEIKENKNQQAEEKHHPKEENEHKDPKIPEGPKKDDEDREISIDFSKIKNLFKPKKENIRVEEKKAEIKKDGENDDEEISIDFKKVKGFFKGLREKAPEEKSEDDIQLNIGKTVDIFKKYQKLLLPALLIIIAISLSVQLRIQTKYLPATDNWAENAVYNQIKSSIRSQINQQYPNLPQQNKDSLVENELQKILKSQKSQIEQQVRATSNYFKSRLQNENGLTHIPDIDPYFWMRHARNILKNGHPGDELRNGKPYDNRMLAPLGRQVPQDMFHAYTMAYFYKFLNFFNKNVDFNTAVFYLPIVLSAFGVIFAFLIGKKLSNNLGGFIAAFVVAIHPSVLVRTAGGFADTDIQNVWFPLMITWLFIVAFESQKNLKRIIFSISTGFSIGLFAFTWGGWFYIFDFILASSFLYLIFFVILNRSELKNPINIIKKPGFYNSLIVIILITASSAVFTSAFTDFDYFKNAFVSGPLAFIKIKQVGIETIWPNVLTTVAEQNPASLDSVISQIGIGSMLLFLISLVGIIITMFRKETKRVSDLWFILGSIALFALVLVIRPQSLEVFLALISLPILVKWFMLLKKKDEAIDIKRSILLMLWFISTIYAGVKGVRYILLAVPAFAIAVGAALSTAYYYLQNIITAWLKINRAISKVLSFILVIILFVGPYNSAKSIAKNEIPNMNDEWYASLKKIDMESNPNAIINSWWDFGHWFKFIADRGVTFDGTSQGSPNAHWIGSVLLTDDEKYAVGVLRMVDCGQNTAFEEIDKVVKNEPKSMKITEDIVRLTKAQSKGYLLNKGFSSEEAENVLKYTHCTPPEDYFITSYDMIGKSGVWAHFGSWNFDKALIYNALKKQDYQEDIEKSVSFLQNEFNYTRERAEDMYYEVQSIRSDAEANSWIAPWPSYAGSTSCSKQSDNNIICDIGQGLKIRINLEDLQADIPTQQGIKHPNSVVLPLEDGRIKERRFNDTIGVSLTLMPRNNEDYNAIIEGHQLANSMFTRMFYLNGHGLKYFDKFSDLVDISGGRIIVWKVNWDGNSTNLLEYYQQKQEQKEQEKRLSEEIANNSQDINTEGSSSR